MIHWIDELDLRTSVRRDQEVDLIPFYGVQVGVRVV